MNQSLAQLEAERDVEQAAAVALHEAAAELAAGNFAVAAVPAEAPAADK